MLTVFSLIIFVIESIIYFEYHSYYPTSKYEWSKIQFITLNHVYIFNYLLRQILKPAGLFRVMSRPFILTFAIELLLYDCSKLKLILMSQKSNVLYLVGYFCIVFLQFPLVATFWSVNLLFLLYYHQLGKALICN